MQIAKLTTLNQCVDLLTTLSIPHTIVQHDAVFTIAEMLEKVKLQTTAPLIKNLFYVDKKKNFYFISAKHDTQIGKGFWSQVGTTPGNVRWATEEHLDDILGSVKGSLNPFCLANDTNKKIKSYIIDERLAEHEYWSFHPFVNTATVELKQSDFNKFLTSQGIKPVFLDLSAGDAGKKDEKAENAEKTLKEDKTEKTEKPEKPEETQKQEAKNEEKGQKHAQKQTVAKEETGETKLKIEFKKEEDLSGWYQQVIVKSEMIEYYDISGCYILRPWSYSIWEQIQTYFDGLIKTDDVENAYFPMFVSQKALFTEKEHVEGFTPEVAWVTKSGSSDLSEPIAIRPTSETIMYPAYSKWINSHRDLPLKLNQWTNIVRWEFKNPTPFIRTREFLWQEGHTAHATKQEADEQTFRILDFYEQTYQELLAIPVIKGIKSEGEKFPGGLFTSTVETWIPSNGRAVQAATSHQLGQNFSKMFNIEFENDKKQKQLVWQTSWGLTTRSLGVMILIHGDNKGAVLPPRVARYQVVIVPVNFKEIDNKSIEDKSSEIAKQLKFNKIRVHIDNRSNYHPGWKYNHWELKGVPIRIELGPNDYKNEEVRVVVRLTGEKIQVKWAELATYLTQKLESIHNEMFENAKKKCADTRKSAEDWPTFITELNKRQVIYTPWCNTRECEEHVKEKTKEESSDNSGLTGGAKTLCMPLEQEAMKEDQKCFSCGKKAEKYVLWGRSY